MRIACYLADTTFTDARAAYLTDWARGGTDDTFPAWVVTALRTHAARTPAQRAEAATEPTGTKRSRSWTVPADVPDLVRRGIVEDNQAGRWGGSTSSWTVEAICAAVDRTRADGPLVDPPARLPNRLVR